MAMGEGNQDERVYALTASGSARRRSGIPAAFGTGCGLITLIACCLGLLASAVGVVLLFLCAWAPGSLCEATNTSAAPIRINHTATSLPDGRVLVAGGQDRGACVRADAQLFDPATGRWQGAAPLIRARQQHTATLLPDGRVLVAGGLFGGPERGMSWLASAELYDPASDRWRETAPLAAARSGHTATPLPGGRVLVVGGRSAGGLTLTSAEVYDPALDRWQAAAPLGTARGPHGHAVG